MLLLVNTSHRAEPSQGTGAVRARGSFSLDTCRLSPVWKERHAKLLIQNICLYKFAHQFTYTSRQTGLKVFEDSFGTTLQFGTHQLQLSGT